MSITRTVDVFCDACKTMWVFGAVGPNPSAREARQNSKRSGWVRMSIEDVLSDVCPRCQKEKPWLGPTSE